MLDRWMRLLMLLAALAGGTVLGACSGGGGGSTGTAPVITLQPTDTTVLSGQTATYSVAATASPAPTYQWRRNGVNIDGATADTYVTPAVALTDGGATYSVVVSNSQGVATSANALLGVNAVTTAEKRNLIDLAVLTAELYLAALAPFELEEEWVLLEPTTVCQSGVGAATLNGVPAFAGQELPVSGTLAATFTNCMMVDGTSFSGTASVVYEFPDPCNCWDGTATFTMTDMRRTTRDNGAIERDYTVNGVGTIVATSASTPSEETISFSATPNAGASLRNELTGLTATFASGGMNVLLGVDTSDNFRLNLAWDRITTTIAGVSYVADGFYELTSDTQGNFTSATGSVNFTANGVSIGRIYVTNAGVFVEVDGVSQPAKAPSRRRSL